VKCDVYENVCDLRVLRNAAWYYLGLFIRRKNQLKARKNVGNGIRLFTTSILQWIVIFFKHNVRICYELFLRSLRAVKICNGQTQTRWTFWNPSVSISDNGRYSPYAFRRRSRRCKSCDAKNARRPSGIWDLRKLYHHAYTVPRDHVGDNMLRVVLYFSPPKYLTM